MHVLHVYRISKTGTIKFYYTKLFSHLNFFLHIESLFIFFYYPVSKILYAKNSIFYFLSTFFENRNNIKNRTKTKKIRSCHIWKQIVVAVVSVIAISIRNNRYETSRESRVPNPPVSQPKTRWFAFHFCPMAGTTKRRERGNERIKELV